MSRDDLYALEDLLRILEKIKNNDKAYLNYMKAFYCLAKELYEARKEIKELQAAFDSIDTDVRGNLYD